MFERHLSGPALRELAAAALQAGLATPDKRPFLLLDLPRAYVATLPLRAAPGDQVLSDLLHLNQVEALDDDVVPLATWLGNAAAHALPPNLRALFQARGEEVLAARGGAPGDVVREAVVYRNDLLPIAFVRAAQVAAQAVARLEVPRVEGGVPAVDAGHRPVRAFGTAWLVAPGLALTNHHVLAAGDADEVVSTPDLAAQAARSVALFDYDQPERPGEPPAGRAVSVRGVLAWSPVRALDYALLELEDAAGAPLRIATAVPVAAPGAAVAVNIVQHPAGAAKQVGLRNNLLVRTTDRDLEYLTDTLAGSSGSPVLNDAWEVVGLHKESRRVAGVSYQGKTTYVVNAGTRIDRVLADLEARFPEAWARVQAGRAR